jgi:hypothetical protein
MIDIWLLCTPFSAFMLRQASVNSFDSPHETTVKAPRHHSHRAVGCRRVRQGADAKGLVALRHPFLLNSAAANFPEWTDFPSHLSLSWAFTLPRTIVPTSGEASNTWDSSVQQYAESGMDDRFGNEQVLRNASYSGLASISLMRPNNMQRSSHFESCNFTAHVLLRTITTQLPLV